MSTVVDDGKARRTFTTGATRDTASGKLDFDGFLSPLVLEAYGAYLDFNRLLRDGGTRASDNWQLGIPKETYMKSGWRHFFDWWKYHRGYPIKEGLIWAATGLMFNVMGYLHEHLKANPHALETAINAAHERRALDPAFQAALANQKQPATNLPSR